MDYHLLVSKIRDSKNKMKKLCIEENDILRKCILCKTYLSPTQWSVLLESYIKKLFGFNNKKSNVSGDAVSLNGKSIEIKVSLGTEKGDLNFVQIRPDHQIDYFLFLAYNVYEDELGKVYWFLAESKDIHQLLISNGQYAHGTKNKNGQITYDNLYGKNFEYSLRPNMKKKNGKSAELWKIFNDKFLRDVNVINDFFNK